MNVQSFIKLHNGEDLSVKETHSTTMVGQVQLSVAIIGGGPGGLGAAIALSELPFVQVTLYEKNSEPREAGAGLSLHTNAWNVLDLLGASDGVKGGAKSNIHQRRVLFPGMHSKSNEY